MAFCRAIASGVGSSFSVQYAHTTRPQCTGSAVEEHHQARNHTVHPPLPQGELLQCGTNLHVVEQGPAFWRCILGFNLQRVRQYGDRILVRVRFAIQIEETWVLPNFSVQYGIRSSSGVKWPGFVISYPFLPSTEIKVTVEQYLYLCSFMSGYWVNFTFYCKLCIYSMNVNYNSVYAGINAERK